MPPAPVRASGKQVAARVHHRREAQNPGTPQPRCTPVNPPAGAEEQQNVGDEANNSAVCVQYTLCRCGDAAGFSIQRWVMENR